MKRLFRRVLSVAICALMLAGSCLPIDQLSIAFADQDIVCPDDTAEAIFLEDQEYGDAEEEIELPSEDDLDESSNPLEPTDVIDDDGEIGTDDIVVVDSIDAQEQEEGGAALKDEALKVDEELEAVLPPENDIDSDDGEEADDEDGTAASELSDPETLEVTLEEAMTDESGDSMTAEEIPSGDAPEAAESGEDIPLDWDHFPDVNMRLFVQDFDEDGNGMLSPDEIANIKEVEMTWEPDTYAGIEYFTELEELTIYNNFKIKSLDLTHNTKLKELAIIRVPRLTQLDLSENKLLTRLQCWITSIDYLDLSENTELIYLDLSDNYLSSLDVQCNVKLVELNANNNGMETLTLGNNTELRELSVIGNNLTTIDIGGCPKLLNALNQGYEFTKAETWLLTRDESLDIYDDETELTYSDYDQYDTDWEYMQLWVFGNEYTGVEHASILVDIPLYENVFANPEIEEPDPDNPCPGPGAVLISRANFPDSEFRDEVSEFDDDEDGWLSAEEIRQITELYYYNDPVESLEGIQYLTELTYVYYCRSNLTEVDVSGLTKLQHLEVWGDLLESVNVEGCSALEFLSVEYNENLCDLDVSDCPNLRELRCGVTGITSLDLTNNPELMVLDCQGPNMQYVDISECPYLQLTLSEGSSEEFTDCEWAFDYVNTWRWDYTQYTYSDYADDVYVSGRISVSPGTTLDLDGTALAGAGLDIDKYFPDPEFRRYVREVIDTDGNGSLTYDELQAVTTISCINGEIESLKGVKYFPNLRILDCSGQQLQYLSLSKNSKLETLVCCDNQLTGLNLSSNPELRELDCSNNALDELDIRKNAKLTEVNCSNNELKGLDIRNNTKLIKLNCSNNRMYWFEADNRVQNDDNTYEPSTMEMLDCSHNQLAILPVRIYASLTHLMCGDNVLGNLNLSQNVQLKNLSCENNALQKLDVNSNGRLEVLNCDGNGLTELTLATGLMYAHDYLTHLYCAGNNLPSVNVKFCEILHAAVEENSFVDNGDGSDTLEGIVDGMTVIIHVDHASKPTRLEKVLKLVKTKITLAKGDTFDLMDMVKLPVKANVDYYTRDECTFSSSSKNAATVFGGVVTAVKKKNKKNNTKTTITVKTNDGLYKATCVVYVKDAIEKVKIVSPTSSLISPVALCQGQSMQIKCKYRINGKWTNAITTKLEYSVSADPLSPYGSEAKVVYVEENGKVTAYEKMGTHGLPTTITVKTYNGKKATLYLTVKEAVPSVYLKVTKTVLKKGETTKATYKAYPSRNPCKFKYVSSNTKVATVTQKGVITAKKKGTAVISVVDTQKAVYHGNIVHDYIIIRVGNAPKEDLGSGTPTCRALLVGLSKFDSGAGDAPRNIGDVRMMEEMLLKVKGTRNGSYQGNIVKLTDATGEDAGVGYLNSIVLPHMSGQDVLDYIDTAFAGATDSDVSLFFIATHGDTTSEGKQAGALVMHSGEMLRLETLAQRLAKVPGKVIVILESCGSGAGIYANGISANFSDAVVSVFASADSGSESGLAVNTGEFRKHNKFYVITAAEYHEESWGLDTYNLLPKWLTNAVTPNSKGIMQADINKNKKVSLTEMFAYCEMSNKTSGQLDYSAPYQHTKVYPESSQFVLFQN